MGAYAPMNLLAASVHLLPICMLHVDEKVVHLAFAATYVAYLVLCGCMCELV